GEHGAVRDQRGRRGARASADQLQDPEAREGRPGPEARAGGAVIGFKDLSIKRKLMLVMMLTSCAALLLACLGFMTYEMVTMRQTMAQELSTLAGIIADNTTAALSFRDTKAAEETLATLGAKRQIVAAAIYGPDDVLFARYLRPGAGADAIPRS